VISPIEGIAGVAQAQVGDLVGPTTMALTTVSTVNPIKVIFTLPEQEYIQSLRRNPTMRSRKEANRIISFELIQADGSVYPKRGKFYSADRSVAVNTGAIFPNPDGVLRPGQYARVRAVKFVEKKAILIPQRAVSELQDRDQVAVVGPDNKIVMHIVHMGERIGSSWIVKDGVKPGESVVVEGGQKIGPGSTVNPTPYVEPPANVTMTQQKRS
jgi:membrane fusion protein (multidrug efflux system)